MLSLCMIVKNEAQHIRAALESVKMCVDEIIVVDTGSTDNTIAIAQSFGAHIVPFAWNDNFAEARNVSLAHAKGDWIMFMDADETIAPQDAQNIPALCANTALAGYLFTQRNYTTHTRCENFQPCSGTYIEENSAPGFVPVDRIALFQNRPEIRFSGIVHETVGPAIQAIGGVVSVTDIAVHHYGHLNQPDRSRKTDYYLQLGMHQIESTPADAKPYYDVGLIYLERGDFILAEKHLVRAYELNPKYEFLCSTLGILYFRWHKLHSALVYIVEAIKHGKNTEQMILLMGTVYNYMNKHADAASVFEQGRELFPHNDALKENLGFALLKSGNPHRAETIFDALIERSPLNPRYVLGGIQAKRALNRPDKAVHLIEQWNQHGVFDQNIAYCSLMVYAELDRRDDFSRLMRQLEPAEKESGEDYFFRAIEAVWNNEQSKAVSLFTKSLHTAPYLAPDIQRYLPCVGNVL